MDQHISNLHTLCSMDTQNVQHIQAYKLVNCHDNLANKSKLHIRWVKLGNGYLYRMVMDHMDLVVDYYKLVADVE